jgi:Family of unknown function (DUF6518)
VLRTALLAALVLIVAAALGVLAQLGDAAPGVPSRATALGAPWLLAGFAVGALWKHPAGGALAGAVALSGATLVYYVVQLALVEHVRALDTGVIAVGWAAAAAGAGAAMGVLGSVWRSDAGSSLLRTAAAAAPAAALAGEAILLAGEWRGRGALALTGAELALAAALLPACAWRRAPLAGAVLAASVLAVAFALGEDEVRQAMRSVGWRGA